MFVGPTRSGKSYFVGACIEQLYRHKHPFVILDTKTKNHIGLKKLPAVKVLEVDPGKAYDWDALGKYPYILCVPASVDVEIEELIDTYRDMLNTLWKLPGERFIVLEEAHNWNKSPQATDKTIEKIAREGAGLKKYLWFISQRLQNFSQLLWSQCAYTYMFKVYTRTDIRYAEGNIPDFSTINANLQQHDCLVWDGILTRVSILPAAEIAAMRTTRHEG
jgi:DNA helicase HerA-like ATPase